MVGCQKVNKTLNQILSSQLALMVFCTTQTHHNTQSKFVSPKAKGITGSLNFYSHRLLSRNMFNLSSSALLGGNAKFIGLHPDFHVRPQLLLQRSKSQAAAALACGAKSAW